MPLVPLQAVALNTLADGFAGKAIDAALHSIVTDISQRGHDGLPRKVVIELTLTPSAEQRVDIDVQVKTKAPAFRPPKTQTKYDTRAGGLVFNTDCRENPDQMTLADIEDDKDE